MLTRIITAVVLIAAVLAWLFKANFEVFSMGALFIYAVSAYEMGPLLGYKSRIPFILIAIVAATIAFLLQTLVYTLVQVFLNLVNTLLLQVLLFGLYLFRYY